MQRAISFVIFMLVSGAAYASEPVITPRIDTNVVSGPSPLAVSFDATGTSHTTATTNTNRFHELRYLWDYDDPDSGTWAPTGGSRNQMSGPLGAHVFEPFSFPDCGGTCKEYTVRLTVKDASGNSASTTKLITVFDPDDPANGWGATGKTICISKTGDFSGCPGVGTTETNTGSFNSILSSKIGSGYRRILFRAGETWTMTAKYTLSTNGPGLIGSYGGDKFAVEFNTGTTTPVGMRGDGWRIQDMHFAGNTTAVYLFVGEHQIKNWLVQRTTSEPNSFQTVVSAPVNFLPTGPDEGIHRHLFFIDNQWGPLDPSTGDYEVFVAAWGLNILGNEFGNAPNEHNIRIQTGESVLVSNNRLGPHQLGKTALNLRDLPNACSGLCPGRPFCGRETRFYLVQDNEFLCNGGACIGATMQTCAGGNDPISPLASADFVFERNFFKAAPGVDPEGAAISLSDGATTRFVVRNNIIDTTGWDWTTGIIAQEDVRIHNNTCYRSDVIAEGKGICVTPKGALECFNNVLYAPNWTGDVLDWKHPKAGNDVCLNEANNLDNSPGGGISTNPFVVENPTNPADFLPKTGSPLIDSGTQVAGVVDDYFGECRTGGPDIGATERVAGGGAGVMCGFAALPPPPDPPELLPYLLP